MASIDVRVTLDKSISVKTCSVVCGCSNGGRDCTGST